MRLRKARQQAADCDGDGSAAEDVADAVMRAEHQSREADRKAAQDRAVGTVRPAASAADRYRLSQFRERPNK